MVIKIIVTNLNQLITKFFNQSYYKDIQHSIQYNNGDKNERTMG
jgi:hypothetical protein